MGGEDEGLHAREDDPATHLWGLTGASHSTPSARGGTGKQRGAYDASR